MAKKDRIEKLDDLIKERIDGELVEQKVSSLLPLGENYGSVMYKVDFKIKKDGKETEYHAVAKCTPPSQMAQELFNTQGTFKAEIAWYTTVIPALKEFAKDQGLKRELDFFQEFYGARISLDPNSQEVDLDGVILTQNLKYIGYYNVDRHRGFDEPTTRNILKDLATFHAVPMAMQLKNPALFDEKIKAYCGKFVMPDNGIQENFNKETLKIFEFFPELSPYLDRVRKVIMQSTPFGIREIRKPWSGVQHLDFWCNNIMITGGKDSKTMILDLQIPMLGSIVGDLVFLLFTSVELSLIKNELDEFLRFYYDEFIKNLEQLKVDTTPYEFEGLLKEIDIEMKAAEFSHILSHSRIILLEKGVASFDSSDSNFKVEQLDHQTIPPPNERQLAKFKWITLEAVKRNWI